MSDVFDIRPEVAATLDEGGAVVALESTVTAHGLPRPINLENALEMEAVVRAEGAVPATIGLVEGRAVVGLDRSEIEQMASSDAVEKVSRRDIAAVLGTGTLGATTVAATICLAARAGIRMMATGGLGGVHRGGETTLDVSADLHELARVPVAVVCAGAKAILDLPRTLEVLETLGVPVVGYQTSDFPAFYSIDSGLSTPHRVDATDGAARLLDRQRSVGLDSGVLLVQPPPAESALPRSQVEDWIATALEEADAQNIAGSEVTPFLLARVTERSDGQTLNTNVALLRNNARLAARIAVALTGLAG